jgi:large subunit ribosomal protein L18
MNTQKLKAKRAERRRFRVRKSMYGTPEKPRLSVHRSNLHISAQLIDDLNGVTVAAATSAGKTSGLKHGSNIDAAKAVGKKIAEAAKAKGITRATFDRGAFRFHGRLAALAVAATEAGLVCTDLESMKAKQAAAAPAAAPAKGEKVKGEGKPKGEGAPKGEGKPKGEKGEKGEGKPKGEGAPKGEKAEKGDKGDKGGEKK